jgi:Terpene synthase family 2, C-terminal metal binding
MIDYCNGAVEHVEDAFNGRIPPLEEYLTIHRRAAGVTPIIALVEYVDSHHTVNAKTNDFLGTQTKLTFQTTASNTNRFKRLHASEQMSSSC